MGAKPSVAQVQTAALSSVEVLADADCHTQFRALLQRELPCELGNGVTVERISVEEFFEFVAVIATRYPQTSRFESEPTTPSKVAWMKKNVDFIGLRKNGKRIAVWAGNCLDWSTYYLRYMLVDPEHRSENSQSLTIDLTVSLLQKAGFSRVQTETAPSHRRQGAHLLKKNFIQTGTLASERWGLLSQFTLFLDQMRENRFHFHFNASDSTSVESHTRNFRKRGTYA